MGDMDTVARGDYEAVEILWGKVGYSDVRRIIMFHMQQAIEKMLKALLEKVDVYVPDTHDINKVMGACKEYYDLPEELTGTLASQLTLWYNTVLYDPTLITDVDIIVVCKVIYDKLLKKFEASAAYTFDTYMRDPGVLMCIVPKHFDDYQEWFKKNFPNGATSREEVMEKINKETSTT